MLRLDEEVTKDHEHFRHMFQMFQETEDWHEKKKFAYEFIRAVSQHSAAEELIMYPAYEQRFENGKEIADNSRAEHQHLKEELYKLDRMVPGQQGYTDQFKLCVDILNEHAKEEEEVLMPRLATACYANEMFNMGEKFVNTKASVPTRPHPSAPYNPTLLSAIGMFQAPIDKAADFFARDFPKVEGH